jgi:hypothetical protein
VVMFAERSVDRLLIAAGIEKTHAQEENFGGCRSL